jgi:HlyD family secretion protein
MTDPDKTDSGARSGDIFDQPVRIVKPAGWMQLGAIVAGLIGAVVWAALLDVPVVVNGKGMLLSVHGVAAVASPSRGTITELVVKEGDDVTQGQLIARVEQPDLRMQYSTKQAMLKEAKERLARHEDLNRRTVETQRAADKVRVEAAQRRIVLLGSELQVLRDRDANLHDLSRRGVVSKDQVLASEAKLHEVEIEIGAATSEIASVTAQGDLQLLQQERDLATIRDQVSQLQTETAETSKLLAAQSEVHSAYTGRIVELEASAGSFIEPGAPLMTLLRDDDNDPTTGPLYALAYVPPADGKNIKKGARVLVSPSSVERSEYGMIRGTVRAVSETPATTAGMMNVLRNDQMVKTLSANGAPFMVAIDLQADASTKSGYAWSASQGPALHLTGGTVADSEIVVLERRLLGVFIPPLARFFREH